MVQCWRSLPSSCLLCPAIHTLQIQAPAANKQEKRSGMLWADVKGNDDGESEWFAQPTIINHPEQLNASLGPLATEQACRGAARLSISAANHAARFPALFRTREAMCWQAIGLCTSRHTLSALLSVSQACVPHHHVMQ